jgi:putative transposase/transposase-like zinc-binding protein
VVEVGDIARGEAERYLETWFATPVQRKAMHDMACCRTAAMGTVQQSCERCEADYWLYRSCGNRSCTLCESGARQKWLEARCLEILPVPYLHVVFATPPELNVLAQYCPEAFYDAVIRAAGQAIIDVGWSKLHAQLGCHTHLQTWTQSMAFYLHAHCMVPCGGFSEDDERWVSFEPDALAVKALSKRFRLLVCQAVRAAAEQGKLDRLPEGVSIEQLLARAMVRKWRVYAKPPFGGPKKLLEYLSRYVYRVAITNDRIESYENGQVTFRGRDSNHENKEKLYTLDAQEFLQRLLRHVPPKGFVRIRSYGFLGNRNRKSNLERARGLIGEVPNAEPSPEPCPPLRLCPACYEAVGTGRRPHFAPCPQLASQIAFTPRPPPIHSVAA